MLKCHSMDKFPYTDRVIPIPKKPFIHKNPSIYTELAISQLYFGRGMVNIPDIQN